MPVAGTTAAGTSVMKTTDARELFHIEKSEERRICEVSENGNQQ